MIRILEKAIADKIAAGEVVERPLSIVKELLENAIDAEADSIILELKKGGKSYIRVTDNGCGIAAGEALLAFSRHATSKIEADGDLERISTLGFRGEALASIAAVSRCEMITKTVFEKTGSRILIEGSETVSNEPVGCPDGTTIIVSDLFYNTPARYKFMKPDAAESGLIIDFVSKMAVAYPGVKIRLINNGNILFATRGGSALDAILTIYGGEIGKNLISVNNESGEFEIEGYVSRHGFSKPNRKTQIFFVNGRNISDKVMEKAVSAAYSDKMFAGRYPVCFIFLRMPPENLDVNIHPNKREVRFDDENKVASFIEQSLKQALLSENAIVEIKESRMFATREKVIETESQVDIKNILSTMRQQEDSSAQTDGGHMREDIASYDRNEFDISGLKVTGSLFSSYITAEDMTSFYLIDQHAAHERIFFETLMKQYHNSEKASQILMLPFIEEAPLALKSGDLSWLHTLREAGFEAEEFGERSYLIKAVPAFMGIEEAKAFIVQFLDDACGPEGFKDDNAIERIMSNACRSAVKAGDRLATAEAEELLSNLSKCDNPFNCPHGRPTFIKLTKDEIEKMFKRK